MSTRVDFDKEARTKLSNGINILADAVKSTLGPSGNTVMIQSLNPNRPVPYLTKDGVTVARSIRHLPDTLENMGAQLVKEVATNTAEAAGDGTTTSIVLVQQLINKGIKELNEGASAADLTEGIRKGTECVVSQLKKAAKIIGRDPEQLINIASISANNNTEIGKLVSDIVCQVGEHGLVSIEDSLTGETYVKKVEGVKIDRGYISPYMRQSDTSDVVVLENVNILMCDNKISQWNEIEPLIKHSLNDKKAILIICEEMDGEALQNINATVAQMKRPICVIKMPKDGLITKDIMEDIAIITNGTLISRDKGHNLVNAPSSYLGYADKVVIDRESTLITGARGKEFDIAARAKMIEGLVAESKQSYEKKALAGRLAKLTSGIGVIYVGGVTEPEVKEKRDRIEDALCAVLAAIDEGVLPGGGVAYLNAIQAIQLLYADNEDQLSGISIVEEAISEPARLILQNAGVKDIDAIIDEIKKTGGDYGYNSKTREYEHFFETGVIDPVKVTRIALENAASIAQLLLNTECVVSES